MLDNLDVLDALLPAKHYKYLVAFQAFGCVVSSCFSYDLDPCYMRYINEFKVAWFDLGLPIICKMHLLIEHLPEVLEKYGMGTALLNESAGESLHADFDRHYQGYIIKNINTVQYQTKLLKAVTSYNSGHI